MSDHSHPRARKQFARGILLDRAREWSDAHVTFERTTDVSGRCSHCDGLITRRLGPGVLCGTCGRLWVVRELLEYEVGIREAV